MDVHGQHRVEEEDAALLGHLVVGRLHVPPPPLEACGDGDGGRLVDEQAPVPGRELEDLVVRHLESRGRDGEECAHRRRGADEGCEAGVDDLDALQLSGNKLRQDGVADDGGIFANLARPAALCRKAHGDARIAPLKEAYRLLPHEHELHVAALAARPHGLHPAHRSGEDLLVEAAAKAPVAGDDDDERRVAHVAGALHEGETHAVHERLLGGVVDGDAAAAEDAERVAAGAGGNALDVGARVEDVVDERRERALEALGEGAGGEGGDSRRADAGGGDEAHRVDQLLRGLDRRHAAPELARVARRHGRARPAGGDELLVAAVGREGREELLVAVRGGMKGEGEGRKKSWGSHCVGGRGRCAGSGGRGAAVRWIWRAGARGRGQEGGDGGDGEDGGDGGGGGLPLS